MAFTEDLSVFFSAAEFADTATHTGAGAPTSGTVIFDANGLVLEEYDVQTTGPTAMCPAAQWPAIAEGDALSIALASGTVAYVVRAVTPLKDGALVLLTLARS